MKHRSKPRNRTALSLPVVALLATALIVSSCNVLSLEDEGDDRNLEGSFESGGFARSYLVHLPPDHEGKQLPVVFVLHGGGGNAVGMRNATGFDVLADVLEFIAVYPQGWLGSWAEGCNCTEADTAGVDDVLFFSELIDELDSHLGIDRSRVYAAGYSAGGFMSHKLACDLTDELTAVASVAGTLSGPLSENCAPAEEIPFLMIHGTGDQVVLYEGEPDLGDFTLLSAEGSAQFWATSNSCGDRLASVLKVGGIAAGIEVWTEAWDCTLTAEVMLHRIIDGSHEWPSDSAFSATREIAEFFDRH